MNTKEYLEWLKNAERLDRELFDMSSIGSIGRLEAILDDKSMIHAETMIGVPLCRRYGGLPVSEYIVLPEEVYKGMRASLKNGEINVEEIHQVIGVPFDKKRFDINRQQIRDGVDYVDLLKLSGVPQDVIDLMRRGPEGRNVKVYKKPRVSFYP